MKGNYSREEIIVEIKESGVDFLIEIDERRVLCMDDYTMALVYIFPNNGDVSDEDRKEIAEMAEYRVVIVKNKFDVEKIAHITSNWR